MAKYSKVFIAEKPSLAKAIVAGIGGKAEWKDGFTLIDGHIAVTNVFGHILKNADPGDYNPDWKQWNVAHLPYNPPQWKSVVKNKDCEKQLKLIETLVKNSSVVVNAGDPDREGQMLIDEVLEYINWTGKTDRMLPNATDIDSIRKALKAIKSNSEYVNLYKSALCRSRADWIIGMSLSVAATKLLSTANSLISVGRVQTPTLALVVNRDLEIENFVEKEFFTLVAHTKANQHVLQLNHSPDEELRIFDRKVAEELANSIKGQTFPLKVEVKESYENPQFPYHLQTLQKDLGKKLGVSAKEVLEIAQKLYDMQLTSYPRTDCAYLPSEQKNDAMVIAKKVTDAGIFTDSIRHFKNMAPKDYIYDTKKAPVHHAIVPTGKAPDGLSGLLLEAYDMICRRFILSLMPAYRYKETKISFTVDGRVFSIKGEVPLNLQDSWRDLDRPSKPPVALPEIQDGTPGKVEEVDIKTGKTTPPQPYDEADLISDMSGVAKFVTDPNIKKILKENSGIGTPATQAGIITAIKDRGYVEEVKKGKSKILKSTSYGRDVIAALPRQLRDPGLTATWEEALKLIAEGQYEDKVFMEKIVNFASKRIEDMKVSTVKVTSTPPNFKPKEFNSTGSKPAYPQKTQQKVPQSGKSVQHQAGSSAHRSQTAHKSGSSLL